MDGRFGRAEFGSVFLQEVADNGRNIFTTIAQWRKVDDDDAEAVVKVFAKLLLANGDFEIAIGGRENANIDGNSFFTAKALEGFLLEDAHEFDLRAEGHVADFIEEDGAAIGLLEAADASFGRASECAAFVAEQFTFEECFGNRGAVYGDERRVRAIAVLEYGARDEFFPGAGFAADEDVDGFGGDAANVFVDVLHGGALADERVASGAGFAEGDGFGYEPIAVSGFGDEGEHLRDVEGLEDVVVCAEFGGFDGSFGGAIGGDENDRQARAGGVKLLDEFKAVETRESEVSDDDVERGLRSAGEAVVTAMLDNDFVAFAGEDALEGVANAGVVFD